MNENCSFCMNEQSFSISTPVQGMSYSSLESVEGQGVPCSMVTIQIDHFWKLTTQVNCNGIWCVTIPCDLDYGEHTIHAVQNSNGYMSKSCVSFFIGQEVEI